ncbi:hypothetical protein BC827DRAFT_1245070 [Russula dissimulans]|nr:hypothetical protein BC827DRAFT_1252091 [Russula dissimulans]KAH9954027.1 hypothetical protein BC827DRAFT_1245070 [Russula dissimulans]
MDKLSTPQCSILPSQLSAQRRASASVQMTENTSADYVIEMAVDAPQLELYSHIEHSKEMYRQAEAEATKVTRTHSRAVLEYSMADGQMQATLLQQLELIKANNHATARSRWYEWRLQWVEQLYSIADQDARTLESIVHQAEKLLPLLREEQAQVIREFEQEQSIATEIKNELKVTLAEQGGQLLMHVGSAALDEFCAEVMEVNAKLDCLEEKLWDLETEKGEMRASIEASQQTLHIQLNITQARAFRLKVRSYELASLEELHLWYTTTLHADLFEFVYASHFHVHIPCALFRPLKDQIRISRAKDMSFKLKDQFPCFTDLSIQVAQSGSLRLPPTWTSNRHVFQPLSCLPAHVSVGGGGQ